jgi:hypothetical protein
MQRYWYVFLAALTQLVLASSPSTSQPVPSPETSTDVTIREARALADETTKMLESTRSIFATPVLSEEKLINELREQRAIASRLVTRTRSMIRKCDIAAEQGKLDNNKLMQQLASLDSLSDEDKGQFSGSILSAQSYFSQALAASTVKLNEALAESKENQAKMEELRKKGIDVDGEKAKLENVYVALSRPGLNSEARAREVEVLKTVNNDVKSLVDKGRRLERDVSSLRAELAQYQKIVSAYSIISGQAQKVATLIGLTNSLQNGENELEAAINRIDDKFVSKLNDNRAKDFFTATSTIVFGIAVIVVIAYFFRLANHDGVRLALFQNDSGLQFVTLFSIVIAIILFGVLRILEGRELAALLGGLSGYILGRGSIGGQSEPRGALATAPAGPVASRTAVQASEAQPGPVQ